MNTKIIMTFTGLFSLLSSVAFAEPTVQTREDQKVTTATVESPEPARKMIEDQGRIIGPQIIQAPRRITPDRQTK